jgi:hypothetical protein
MNFNEEVLEQLKEINKSVSRTERNVAFFAWLTILSMVAYGLYLWSLS